MNSVMPKMRRRRQAGYTLLMVVFMVAAMIIAAAAVTPNLLTEGRREKEAEMVWRGEQYSRAIGLYYRKFGKYPTKVEDLTKQTNGVRFLRQAYTDPMNKDDGSWRFIYVGPNGQLIGSLRQTSLLQSTLSAPGLGGALSLGGGLQPLAPPGTTPGATPGAAPGMNRSARRGPTGTANESGRGRESPGVPASTVGRNRHGRQHHRSRKQNQKAFCADLSGRRNLPGVGIHLESDRANRSAGASARKSERESHCRSKHNQSKWSESESPGRTAAAASAGCQYAASPVGQASACRFSPIILKTLPASDVVC